MAQNFQKTNIPIPKPHPNCESLWRKHNLFNIYSKLSFFFYLNGLNHRCSCRLKQKVFLKNVLKCTNQCLWHIHFTWAIEAFQDSQTATNITSSISFSWLWQICPEAVSILCWHFNLSELTEHTLSYHAFSIAVWSGCRDDDIFQSPLNEQTSSCNRLTTLLVCHDI